MQRTGLGGIRKMLKKDRTFVEIINERSNKSIFAQIIVFTDLQNQINANDNPTQRCVMIIFSMH